MATARRSADTLDMLLLSLLATNGPLSGYQAAGLLQEAVALIWPVKHSQIYPALVKLDGRGDVSGSWEEQTGRPNKKSYRLTARGRERLIDWLSEHRTTFSRDEIMLIVYNLALVGAPFVDEALSRFRTQCEIEKSRLEERWALAIPPRARLEKARAREQLSGVRAMYEMALIERDALIRWSQTAILSATGIVDQIANDSSM